jgi:hypothetical protein
LAGRTEILVSTARPTGEVAVVTMPDVSGEISIRWTSFDRNG